MFLKYVGLVGVFFAFPALGKETVSLGEYSLVFVTQQSPSGVQAELRADGIVESRYAIRVDGPVIVADGKTHFIRGDNNNQRTFDFFCRAINPDFSVADGYEVYGIIKAGILALTSGANLNEQIVGANHDGNLSMEVYTLTTPPGDATKSFTCADSRNTIEW